MKMIIGVHDKVTATVMDAMTEPVLAEMLTDLVGKATQQMLAAGKRPTEYRIVVEATCDDGSPA